MKPFEVLQYILYALELAACIVAFLNWRKPGPRFWIWFPVYLLFIVLADQAGNLLNIINTKTAASVRNAMFDYAVMPAEFLFFCWFYYKNADTRAGRRLALVCIAVYLAGFAAGVLYFDKQDSLYFSFSYCVGSVALVAVIIQYLIQFARSEQILQFRSSPMFWISIGLLVFYITTLPFFGFYNLLREQLYPYHRELFYAYVYGVFACNFLMYILFIAGFLWAKRN